MKAVVKTKPGKGNVDYIYHPEPTPGPHEVKIKVKAAGICGTDTHIYHDTFPSFPPVVMGHEFSGEVVALGRNVKNIVEGDRVIAEAPVDTCKTCLYCKSGYPSQCLHRRGLGWSADGAFAQYTVVNEDFVHILPLSIDYEEGTLIEPLAFSTYAVTEEIGVRPGDLVYISGPGPIGLFTAQVVMAAGASVILGGRKEDQLRLSLAEKLGVEHTVTVEEEDPASIVHERTKGLGADVVFECSGSEQAANQCLDIVRKRGTYAQIGFFGKPIHFNFDTLIWKNLRLQGVQGINWRSWERAIRLVCDHQIELKAMISHRLPLSDWHKGFEMVLNRESVKVLLIPEDT